MLIDTTDEATFPIELKGIIRQYLLALPQELLKGISESKIEYSNDVMNALENHFAPYRAHDLYAELIAVLHECSLISYHATRVLNDKEIVENGLHANSWDWYKRYFTETLTTLGVSTEDVVAAVAIVKAEYDRKYSQNRKPQVCFFSKLPLFEQDDGSAAYDQFCENIGGELARWALKDELPPMYKILETNGHPIIVKVALPFKDISEHLHEKIAFQFICFYVARYFWNYEYEIEYDCITNKNVTPDKLLGIIPVTVNQHPLMMTEI